MSYKVLLKLRDKLLPVRSKRILFAPKEGTRISSVLPGREKISVVANYSRHPHFNLTLLHRQTDEDQYLVISLTRLLRKTKFKTTKVISFSVMNVSSIEIEQGKERIKIYHRNDRLGT